MTVTKAVPNLVTLKSNSPILVEQALKCLTAQGGGHVFGKTVDLSK